MSGAAKPQYITSPWALNGAFDIPSAVANPAIPQAASFDQGFPAITLIPLAAGGEPPRGQDMNGILNMLSAYSAFNTAGQWLGFDPVIAAAIGGYAKGAVVAMADKSGFWVCTTDGAMSNPDTGGAGWASLASYGQTAVTLSNVDVFLSPAQYSKRVIVLSGTLTSNVNVLFPKSYADWIIVNNTTGAFVVRCLTTSQVGTSVTIQQNGVNAPTGIFGDGTSVYPSFLPPAVLSIDVNPTPNTIPKRDSNGVLYAGYFNMYAGVENTPIGGILTTGPGDGLMHRVLPSTLISQLNLAILASPVFTGAPTTPTASAGSFNAQIANTAYVDTGLALRAPLLNAALQGAPSVPNAPANSFNTQIANTAYVDTGLALKAALASPPLTGVPTAPTAALGTNTTQLATTAFVHALGTFHAQVNGSMQLPMNGGTLIINWGFHTTVSANVPEAITFDVAFPSACLAFVVLGTTPQHTVTSDAPSSSQTGNRITSGVGGAGNSWIAIGY